MYYNIYTAIEKSISVARVILNMPLSFRSDCHFDGIAAVDMNNHMITVNTTNIEDYLDKNKKFFFDKNFPFLQDESGNFDAGKYALLFCSAVILHEIGHIIHSGSPREITELYDKYCASLRIPTELVWEICNIVEDANIQRQIQLENPSQWIRNAFLVMTTIIQGPIAKDEFKNALEVNKSNPAESFSIKAKLFYLILRAYNLTDEEVQSMFGNDAAIGLTPVILRTFDKIFRIPDDKRRAEETVRDLCPLIWEFFKNQLQQDNSSSSNGQQSQQSQQGQQSDASTNDSDSDNQNTDGGESCDSDGTEKEGSSGSNSEDKNQTDQNQSSNSDGTKEDKESDSQSAKEGGDGVGQGSNSTEEQLAEKIRNAIEELTQEIHNVNYSSRDLSEEQKEKIKNNLSSYTEEKYSRVIESSVGYLSYEDKQRANNSSRTSRNSLLKPEEAKAYLKATTTFSRLFNIESDCTHYLDSGELDEDTMMDFYTEKSINIFKDNVSLIQNKNIKCIFLLDYSGSMGGQKIENVVSAVPAMVHALEDNNIKTRIYKFQSDTFLLKDFDDDAIIHRNHSNIKYQLNHKPTGGTNIVPCLLDLINMPVDADTVYIVFTFTDGCVSSASKAREIFRKLSDNNFNLFGVTLDDNNEYYKNNLINIMGVSPEQVRAYTIKEILTKIADDIYDIIINKFIKY